MSALLGFAGCRLFRRLDLLSLVVTASFQECNAASSCFCTDGNIDMFATCIDCMVSVDPGGANGLLGQTAIDGEHVKLYHDPSLLNGIHFSYRLCEVLRSGWY